jgi:sulfur relay (sulfurtransferase) DsrF/TusC family protein
MLDTAPAGNRLTREAVAAILALFAEFDPKGRQRFVINEQSAVIRSVYRHRAEELAAALVRIANGCSVRTPPSRAQQAR